MSWNKYFIVIKDVPDLNLPQLVDLTGYGKILKCDRKVDFRRASNKNYEGIGFGKFDGNFWIISSNQTEKFFEPEPGILERNLCKKFPQSTIMALAENGTVDAFGLNLIRNGKRVRVISGCDGEYEFEFGEVLEIEKANRVKVEKELTEEMRREIIEHEGEKGLKEYIQFESLWRTPFNLLYSQTGKSIGEVYEINPEFAIFNRR